MGRTRPIEFAFELPQTARNRLGEQLLRLTLREEFDWRYLQSDPNFGNYLLRGPGHSSSTDDDGNDDDDYRVVLLDFGATRAYVFGRCEDRCC